MGFKIQQSCPQCGAPIELEETDRLIECPYCEARSIMSPTDCLRYVMQHNAKGKDIVYAPYIRFKGAAFYCQGDDIDYRVVDISDAGTSLKVLRPSLGVRTQTVKANFVSPDLGGTYLPVDKDAEEIVARAAKLPNVKPGTFLSRPATTSNGISIWQVLSTEVTSEGDLLEERRSRRNLAWASDHSRITPETDPDEIQYYVAIGENLSIVYFPLYREGDILYDAIINDPIGEVQEEDKAILGTADANPRWQVKFLPIMCPYCGWDLKGSRSSVAFTCSNCFSAWEISSGKLRQASLLVVPPEQDNAEYLPFWRINATCPDLGVSSYADLIRLDKPLTPAEQIPDIPVSFIIPAFKIAPKMLLTTAQRMTFSQHILPPVQQEAQVHSISAVTLPRDEAIESIKIVLANGAYEKHDVISRLTEAQVHATDSALIYLPFNDSGYELSAQYGIQVSIIKQSLELVSDLAAQKKVENTVTSLDCPLCGKDVPASSSHCPYCGIRL